MHHSILAAGHQWRRGRTRSPCVSFLGRPSTRASRRLGARAHAPDAQIRCSRACRKLKAAQLAILSTSHGLFVGGGPTVQACARRDLASCTSTRRCRPRTSRPSHGCARRVPTASCTMLIGPSIAPTLRSRAQVYDMFDRRLKENLHLLCERTTVLKAACLPERDSFGWCRISRQTWCTHLGGARLSIRRQSR